MHQTIPKTELDQEMNSMTDSQMTPPKHQFGDSLNPDSLGEIRRKSCLQTDWSGLIFLFLKVPAPMRQSHIH